MNHRFKTIVGKIILGTVLALVGGCVELGLVLPPNPDNDNRGSASGNPNDNGDDSDLPVVQLTASNTTPSLGEEVTLTCRQVNGNSDSDTGSDAQDTTFAYQSSGGALVVNASTGVASFIVDESHLSTTVRITCTGTNTNGTGNPSNAVVILPTSLIP